MRLYSDVVQDRNGNVVSGATVTVTLYPSGTSATVYASNVVGANVNPLTTDANGKFSFYAANGNYTLTIAKTGITTTTVSPVLIQDLVVSVTEFGAIGDGTTDDTTAILATVANVVANSRGGTVFFPPGVYKTTATIDFADTSNVYIRGSGNSSVIKPSTAVTTAVKFGTTSAQQQGIFDIGIDCVNATACVGVKVTGVQNFTLINVGINAASIALQLAGTANTIQFFSDFRITDTKVAGIKIEGGNDQFFSSGTIVNSFGSQPTTGGIWITANNAAWFDGIDVLCQSYGLRIEPASTAVVEFCFFLNCSFDSCTNDGIVFAPGASASVVGMTFTNCWTASNGAHGVDMNTTTTGVIDLIRFVGHRSFNNLNHGYAANGATTKNVNFSDCEASGNDRTTSGSFSGFNITSVGSFAIRGCRSGQAGGFSNTQTRGITVSGTCDNYVITDNDLRGNASSAMSDAGSGTTKIVADNLGYNPIASTAITVTASPFTYTNVTGAGINVFVTGGTVSGVTMAGSTVAAATNCVVHVPHNQAVVVTYSSAPTMKYLGD